MPQNFANGGSLTATQNQNIVRVFMQYQRRLNQALMINKFVQLGGLHFAIED